MFARIIFNRRNRLCSRGLANIEIEYYVTRNFRFYRSTGINVLPSEWDERNSRVNNKHSEALFINTKLIELKYKAEQELLHYNPEDYKVKKPRKRYEQLFYVLFQGVIDKNNIDLSQGTKMIYARTLRYLKEFQPTDIPLRNVDLDFVERFDVFLKTEKKLSKNSRSSILRKLKKCMAVFVASKLLNYADNPFLHFKIKEEPVEKKTLSLAELKSIEQADTSQRPELQRTKDMFLFACYTAMRFGDLSTLSWENFTPLPDNRLRLSYMPSKTKKLNGKRIEWVITDFWNGKADEIILRYHDQKNFFAISNGKYNEQLKELGRFAGINQPLTSHLARHSCITLLINEYGLDITKAQLIAGHSKIEMTRVYLKTTETDLANAAKKIKW